MQRMVGVPDSPYDEDGRLLAQHGSGGAVFEYVYLDGEPIAFVRSAGLYGGGTKTLYYYHTDHLGTPRRATDQAKAVKWFGVEPYDPFDMRAVSYIFGPGMTFPALRFAGQSTDEMTPYFYNYYRDYDPFKGTYLQSDPIGLAGGVNSYAYANGNPLKFVDPTGEFAWWWVPVAVTAYEIGSTALDLIELERCVEKCERMPCDDGDIRQILDCKRKCAIEHSPLPNGRGPFWPLGRQK